MSAYEDFKGRWQGQEGSLCSIAISLKRIADKLTADDVAVDRSAAGIKATPSPAGPDSEDDSQPDGPVVDGRTVKVGDRVRLRSGDVLPVLEVIRYPDPYYPWQIRHYANRRPELYGSTGRQMHDGFDHHNDIVGFVDEPELAPSPAPVDLSQLRPGDAIRFAGGRLWLVRGVGPLDDGYYVMAVDAWIDRLNAARFSRMGHPTGGTLAPRSSKSSGGSAMSDGAIDPSGLRRGDVVRFQDSGFAIVGTVSGAMRNLTRVVYFTAYGKEIKEFRPDGRCDTDINLRIVRVIRRGIDE